MNLICGINPVLEALNAGTRHFERLLVVKGVRHRRIAEAIAAASRLGVALRFEARETLDRLSGGVPHQGLIAVVSAKPTLDLDDLLAKVRSPALLAVLDGVEDPRNLGAILRTCEAAGADGVVLPERHSAGLSDTVARASAGALEYVKVAKVGNLSQALEKLKQSGIWVIGLDAAGTERWDAVDLTRPVALVLGGEGRGIRRLVREHCDQLVSLPLFGHVASLNVSVAAGIALYEVVRQRGSVPSHVRPIPSKAVADASIVGPGSDDSEHDPGAFVSRGAHHGAHRDDEGDGAGDGAHDASAPDVVRLNDEDEVAWGLGPTVVKGGVQRHGRWGRENPSDRRNNKKGRRRDGADGRPRTAESAARPVEAPAQAPAPEGPGDRQGRRRKRRRGRGDSPARAAASGAPNGAPAAEAGNPRSEGQPPAPGAPPNGEPRGDKRGRGRRRRRGRRPGGPAGAPPSSASASGNGGSGGDGGGNGGGEAA